MKLKKPQQPKENPVAQGSIILATILPRLGLDEEDLARVGEELTWLFNAADNYQQVLQAVEQRLADEGAAIRQKLRAELPGKYILIDKRHEQAMAELKPRVWQEEIERSQPVVIPTPASAEAIPGANNRLRPGLTVYNLERWGGQLQPTFHRLDMQLRSFNILLNNTALHGQAGKGDVALQNQITETTKQMIKSIRDLAGLIHQAYGILVTSPDQLLEFLEQVD